MASLTVAAAIAHCFILISFFFLPDKFSIFKQPKTEARSASSLLDFSDADDTPGPRRRKSNLNTGLSDLSSLDTFRHLMMKYLKKQHKQNQTVRFYCYKSTV